MSSSTSSHKPRSRAKRTKGLGEDVSRGRVVSKASSDAESPQFPLAAFLWPARKITSQWVTLPLILMAVGLFRWTAGLWTYSGYKTPPMHGDFEAQRHWLEITTHLPLTQWYFHDLEWWGLDYPPLTAYHSWLLGKIGSVINPAWFALHSSRGLDDPGLKIYMRATVLISEYLTFVPAAVFFVRRYVRHEGLPAWEGSMALTSLLMQPSLILIDHVHFQYNTVMLGFVLASIAALTSRRYLWGCVFFVAALGFKQMALYYAPAMFAYLLAMCFQPRFLPARLIGIAMVTAATFAVLMVPFVLLALRDGPIMDGKGGVLPVALSVPQSLPLLRGLWEDRTGWFYPPLQQVGQCIHRVFPFARGIFEDKVANVWCALNVLVKLRRYPVQLLQQASLLATLAAILPPSVILFDSPRKDLFLVALAATSWGFFLCSFQVHEKSVLLPLLPMTLTLALPRGLRPANRAWVGWANMLGAWTMFPLLKRDQARVPYFVLSLLWAYLLGLPPTSLSVYTASRSGLDQMTQAVHLLFYALMAAWHLAEAFITPPAGKADLWVVVNVGIGAAGFSICYLWCLWECWSLSRRRVSTKVPSKRHRA
ncbi:MAG: Glucosyltransferase-like protein [Caeruleum heppii]|nr:MAG: Glucosyltransferase-like protein [Caeruleum heppii]